jgi:histidyl-tRNA synthetase
MREQCVGYLCIVLRRWGRRQVSRHVLLLQDALVQLLRDGGWRTDFALSAAKVGKQFQAAEALGAQFAVVVGAEWPELKIKALATRTEHSAAPEQLVSQLRSLCVTQPSA